MQFPPLLELAKRYAVEIPIISAVDSVINHNSNPKEAVKLLMGRDTTTELSKPILAIYFESAVIKNSALRIQGD